MSQTGMIYCTTREAAEMLGVSLRTVQLWTENGLLEAWKTEGGHRRISRASVLRLLGQSLQPTVDLGVPGNVPIKLLVVEDDGALLKLYKTVIASWHLPIDLITASNGVEGLIRVGRDSPDLMITDLMMPGMDGFELIRSLAFSTFREGMRIVVITGLDPAEIAEQGGLPNGIRVLHKPIPFNELRTLVLEMVQQRSSY